MGMTAREPETLARPIAFDGCAGWLHPARGDVGVLLLGPWGFEAICLRRAFRMLGDLLAGSGYPTLRFDWPGTGDSLGGEAGLTLADLEGAARAAAGILRRAAGVRRIVVVGQGLGAVIAARLAPELPAAGAALLAPIVRGREALRELALWGRTVAETMGLEFESGEGAGVAGFALPPGLQAALSDLDLGDLARPPAPEILLATRPGRASDVRLARRMAEHGAAIVEIPYEGYELAVANPTASRPPVATMQALATWLAARFPPARPARAAPSEPAVLETPEFVETALRFGSDGRLCGVLCEPRGLRRGAAVLMLSAGGDPHAGWARGNVEHARALARQGVASLRMDATDVGDAAGPLSERPIRLYDERHIDDALAAIDWMQARGLSPVLPVGRCSGAFAAFNAAARDPRIADIVLVNQLRYIWDRDGEFERASEKVGYYQKKVRNPAKLVGRWLRGEIDIEVALAKLSRAAVALLQAKLAGQARLRRRQIRETFGGLQARGVRVNLLISRDREAHEVFRQFFGPEGKRLTRFGDIRLKFLEGADHALTSPAARAALFDLVLEMALSSPAPSVQAIGAGQSAAERQDLALRGGVEGGLLPT